MKKKVNSELQYNFYYIQQLRPLQRNKTLCLLFSTPIMLIQTAELRGNIVGGSIRQKLSKVTVTVATQMGFETVGKTE